ncbi:putative transcriptional regulatory protein [Clavispora lusitaniae]|uniref:Transcriptional regulatory protein n=1 Tax=Clavispora lusitaniae TaxID=36911 RepID=A0ACD0WSD4_CLALS|nr:putative transcriptional regulatory protein [Clavispora lusitaniae]QFZ35611.1 putative transcriptional regulatory protein [Clavispora lusitaniae]QFZ41293.1 putative transcriptional regulatory protein [Clavispora lusitaniae]QFZ46971.1 putative transcriptional regulatory protein [Clavispora lusitaniae]QFZ52648.1 putative transcriptional regulatory protein [Clavispora lusitaniae]
MRPKNEYKEFQLVLRVKNDKIITRKPIRLTKRSSTGCLNCKRKKIKCDETKDQCKRCLRSGMSCVWPPEKAKAVPKPEAQNGQDLVPHVQNLPLIRSLGSQVGEAPLDAMFFAFFTNGFLPTIAKPHFYEKLSSQGLLLSAADNSAALREIYIACGASLAAREDVRCKDVAQRRYKKALESFVKLMKHGRVNGYEDWFFVAVQVLQTLCLRDSFSGSNATRCAAHFNAAYKVIAHRLFAEHCVRSPLEKMMIENFIFNYSITIFYCEKAQIEALIPNPFDFFAHANSKLNEMSLVDGSPHTSRMSMQAFQIAAKCSWSCRLHYPLSAADQRLHWEMFSLAETLLFSLDSTNYDNNTVQVQNTVYIAKVVLRASIILLRKMLFPATRAADLQDIVKAAVNDISQPCNEKVIFPIWALMIAASASLDASCRRFFVRRLECLFSWSKSQIAKQVVIHLEGLWELYKNDEPFELLFNSDVLDEVCR